MRIPINPHLIKLRKRRRPGARIRNFEAMGLRMAQQLEPHVDFDIRRRLQYEIGLADPSLPFPGDPLPEERPIPPRPGYADAAVQTETTLIRIPDSETRRIAKTRLAIERAGRFCTLRSVAKALRIQDAIRVFNPRAVIRVANGEAFDPAAILEDREYELREMVGTESDFHFRLIPWGGGRSRAIVSSSRLVTLLGGRAHSNEYERDIVEPVMEQCQAVEAEVRRRHPDEAHPVLSGGVGEHFNRTPDAQPAPGPSRVLDCLAFFALFSTVAMCQLLGFANGLMGMYCSYAYNTLSLQKARFLSVKPDAETEYPCPASIFSAATIEFGGPHRRLNHRGDPHDFLPGDWCILTSVGRYRHLHGGHIILWDFGLVIQFPPATHILLPAGLIRYSFVKVQPHETRYSIIQWAGSGIQRFLENNNRTDLDFAKFATEVEYTAREAQRQRNHVHSLESLPRTNTLEEGPLNFPYPGPNPPDDPIA